MQPAPSLPSETTLGTATLAVANLGRSLEFYENVIGLKPLEVGDHSAKIGTGETPVLILNEKPNAKPQPSYSTGLYHVAILVPHRAALARVVAHWAETQHPIQGYADHLVSEAFYLADPDGNGLEVYRDRPREEWQMENGMIRMDNQPIDFESLMAELDKPLAPWQGLPTGTKVGHMHLRVGNIQQAQQFYNGVLGFDLIFTMPSALFVSAGGYHHHLGMNIWHSRNAPPPPAEAVGLQEFTVILPTQTDQEALRERLDQAGGSYTVEGADLLVRDPWQTALRFASR